VKNGHFEMAEHLLEKGANIEANEPKPETDELPGRLHVVSRTASATATAKGTDCIGTCSFKGGHKYRAIASG
jgi:hypothetical protein